MEPLATPVPWSHPAAPGLATVAPSTTPGEPVYVHPGHLACAPAGTSFITVVGSGVTVCIWDPVRRVGGMAHFLLPEAAGASPAPRYGDVALKSLLDQLGALGGRSYRAAVLGGSAPPIASETGHLGDRNVSAALAMLALRGIRVNERDVGGTGARKVLFDPTGSVVSTKVGG